MKNIPSPSAKTRSPRSTGTGIEINPTLQHVIRVLAEHRRRETVVRRVFDRPTGLATNVTIVPDRGLISI
jgi:hypothetical protein